MLRRYCHPLAVRLRTEETATMKMQLVIRERQVLDEQGKRITEEPNFLGSLAVYRLGR